MAFQTAEDDAVSRLTDEATRSDQTAVLALPHPETGPASFGWQGDLDPLDAAAVGVRRADRHGLVPDVGDLRCERDRPPGLGMRRRTGGKRSGRDAAVWRLHQLLMRRAAYLPLADQSLLRLALEGEHSLRELGPMFGLSAGGTCRRIQTLKRRLRDPVVALLIDFPVDLPELHRRVGVLRLLLGQSIRAIALETGRTIGEVRSMLAYVRGWARIAQQVWIRTAAEQAGRLQDSKEVENEAQRSSVGGGTRA